MASASSSIRCLMAPFWALYAKTALNPFSIGLVPDVVQGVLPMTGNMLLLPTLDGLRSGASALPPPSGENPRALVLHRYRSDVFPHRDMLTAALFRSVGAGDWELAQWAKFCSRSGAVLDAHGEISVITKNATDMYRAGVFRAQSWSVYPLVSSFGPFVKK